MTTEKPPKELPVISDRYLSRKYFNPYETEDAFEDGKQLQLTADQLLYNALWAENERLKEEMKKLELRLVECVSPDEARAELAKVRQEEYKRGYAQAQRELANGSAW